MHPRIALSAHPPAAPPSRGAQRAARAFAGRALATRAFASRTAPASAQAVRIAPPPSLVLPLPVSLVYFRLVHSIAPPSGPGGAPLLPRPPRPRGVAILSRRLRDPAAPLDKTEMQIAENGTRAPQGTRTSASGAARARRSARASAAWASAGRTAPPTVRAGSTRTSMGPAPAPSYTHAPFP